MDWQPLAYSTILWNLMESISDTSVPPDEILTLKEVAKHLKVGEKTVYTMAQNKELPSFKVRGQWRFRREDIDQWIDEQKARNASERADE